MVNWSRCGINFVILSNEDLILKLNRYFQIEWFPGGNVAKWIRYREEGSKVVHFGQLSTDELHVLEATGNLFDQPQMTGKILPLEQVQLEIPCTPSKYIGLWNNFFELAKKTEQAIPTHPLYFIKSANAYLPHLGTIVPPTSIDPAMARIFYEGELGIVIGQSCKEITEAQAVEAIFGYTCVNDVTAFEVLNSLENFKQWSRAKSYDTFGPFGPCINTTIDPDQLTVRVRMGGRERQNYPLSDMILSPAKIVSLLSMDMTLEPGDLIACGTSIGALPMKKGQLIEVEIDGIGILKNTFGALDD